MKQNIEQLVNKILRGAKISSPPIKSEILAESYFDLDFDCVELKENELAGLKVAEKKISRWRTSWGIGFCTEI